jgi:hypothetical protein
MLRKPKDTHIHIYMKKCRCIIFQSWHRVDRVLSFFSSRPNWNYPTPSHAGDVCPSFGSGGGGGFTLIRGRGGEDVGESQFRRGDRHFGTLGSRYICTLLIMAKVKVFRINTIGHVFIFHKSCLCRFLQFLQRGNS